MIEGRLTERGRDPLHTQVVLRTVEHSVHLSLQDETGVFEEFEPPEPEEPEDPLRSDTSEADSSDAEEAAEAALVAPLRAQVAQLEQELEAQKTRTKDVWRQGCEQVTEMDQVLSEKDNEIGRLRDEVARLRGRIPSAGSAISRGLENRLEGGDAVQLQQSGHPRTRRGKAPPVDVFTGEDRECRLDDWLPNLKRAADWNSWAADDLLIQLAGHLKGRALQEWNLFSESEKSTYEQATASLRSRLDPGSKLIATQDFRHAAQEENEKVGDFVRRLEQSFKIAYGHDNISAETRSTLLYGQLQEGLKYHIMEAPAVSGATDYTALCLAARAEEKRLVELKKRRQDKNEVKSSPYVVTPSTRTEERRPGVPPSQPPGSRPQGGGNPRNRRSPNFTAGRCWNCDEVGHVMAECTAPKAGGSGRPMSGAHPPSSRTPWTRQVHSSPGAANTSTLDPSTSAIDPAMSAPELRTHPHGGETATTAAVFEESVVDPLQFLLPDTDDETDARVTQVRVYDKGSDPQTVRVVLAGVPIEGMVDTGADITLVGAEAFKRIAAVAKLRRRDFKPADKIPRTYDQKTFHIDGRIDLDITFEGTDHEDPVYVKMDAREQLLLSEGVCRQLGIVTYHEEVMPGNRGARPVAEEVTPGAEGYVPMVRVRLLQSVRLKPGESVVAEVELVGDRMASQTILLETEEQLQEEIGAQIAGTLARVMLTNHHSLTHKIDEGIDIGHAVPVEVVEAVDLESQNGTSEEEQSQVNRVADGGIEYEECRKRTLASLLEDKLAETPWNEKEQLTALLEKHHEAFNLMDGERGETDLTTMHIDTADAAPKKQPVRRIPFAVRQEVAKQLQKMQTDGVIQPSSSPWASAIVLVRKKDGTLRICVDYRHLNSVTKADTFPLPRIDDLLDQLGSAKYFTTLDLAAGYWQIRVADDSIEKTAFVAPSGLFEFRVMPFGLTNAPAIFQRLMQRVLSGLNPADGPDFVSVYIDDILVSSRTMEEHLRHIELVLDRLQAAGLKLKLGRFLCQRVEY